jgi:hypothetical protein
MACQHFPDNRPATVFHSYSFLYLSSTNSCTSMLPVGQTGLTKTQVWWDQVFNPPPLSSEFLVTIFALWCWLLCSDQVHFLFYWSSSSRTISNTVCIVYTVPIISKCFSYTSLWHSSNSLFCGLTFCVLESMVRHSYQGMPGVQKLIICSNGYIYIYIYIYIYKWLEGCKQGEIPTLWILCVYVALCTTEKVRSLVNQENIMNDWRHHEPKIVLVEWSRKHHFDRYKIYAN